MHQPKPDVFFLLFLSISQHLSLCLPPFLPLPPSPPPCTFQLSPPKCTMFKFDFRIGEGGGIFLAFHIWGIFQLSGNLWIPTFIGLDQLKLGSGVPVVVQRITNPTSIYEDEVLTENHSDSALLWPAAATPIRPLACERPYDAGTALKRKKKKLDQGFCVHGWGVFIMSFSEIFWSTGELPSKYWTLLSLFFLGWWDMPKQSYFLLLPGWYKLCFQFSRNQMSKDRGFPYSPCKLYHHFQYVPCTFHFAFCPWALRLSGNALQISIDNKLSGTLPGYEVAIIQVSE